MRAIALLVVSGTLALASRPADCLLARKLGKAQEARACFEQLAKSADALDRAEGLWGLERYVEAKAQFERALAARPQDPHPRVRYGLMFMERFNSDEALKLFNEAAALKKDDPETLAAVARLFSDSFDRRAIEVSEQAIAQDPKLVDAHELLAQLSVEDLDLEKGRKEADVAISLSPYTFEAMAVRAAADLIEDKPTEWLDRVYAVNPHYGKAPALVAHLLVLNRRYDDGIQYYRKAIEIEPTLWPARSELGVNLMRMGSPVEARRLLEECYDSDYRNKPTTNSLTLLDSYKKFVTIPVGPANLVLNRKEAEVLRPYVERETLRALAHYDKKYNMKLPGPVTVEMFPDHEDFAVRSLGMPGLGALGVTFGLSVAMDSPSGRPPGTFHWASTLWHELSHVYVLTATNNRGPRWFTEGISVHEETASGSPEWGDRLDPAVIRVIQKKQLLPVAQLDRGFIRPANPHQIIVSYFQAGRIVDYIAQKWGEAKVLEMIHAFATVQPTPVVIQKCLGVSAADFDKEFLAWLEVEHKSPLTRLDEWTEQMKGAAKATRAKEYTQVISICPNVIKIYPDYVEGGSAYELLASAYEATGDKPQAAATLSQYARHGGRSPELLKKLASLEEELGNKREAGEALARINCIAPVGDEELHIRLGALWADLGNWTGAAEEYRAVLASKPVDAAAAHYNLARAWRALGKTSDAQEQLLMALEAAPGYRPAQKLLLELNRQEGKKDN
jgi:cellulose synthase operon protein C